MTSSAKKALVAEATESVEDVVFEFDGETYTVPRNAIDDVEVIEAYEDQHVTIAARALLGPAQWAAFKSKKRKMAELYALLKELFAAIGISVGESSD